MRSAACLSREIMQKNFSGTPTVCRNTRSICRRLLPKRTATSSTFTKAVTSLDVPNDAIDITLHRRCATQRRGQNLIELIEQRFARNVSRQRAPPETASASAGPRDNR